jgi:hypothetical protein
LDNHLGQGKTHRLIGTGAAVLRGRIEVAGTHLRHLKGHLAHTGEHGFGLEAVGVVTASDRALVGRGAEKLGTFDLGSLVDRLLCMT